MNSGRPAIHVTGPIRRVPSDEDAARADLYGLLAALFLRAPDDALVAALAARHDPFRPPAGTALDDAFRALAAEAAALGPGAIRDEHDAVFGGVGRPEILLHGSWYLSGFLHDRPLVDLRADLARLGLRHRVEGVTEDHVALLCGTLRHLIVAGDPGSAGMETQRAFFHAHLGSWADRLVDAIEASPGTRFYRRVAGLMRVFLDVEREAFEIG